MPSGLVDAVVVTIVLFGSIGLSLRVFSRLLRERLPGSYQARAVVVGLVSTAVGLVLAGTVLDILNALLLA